eukprot:scaffold27944_cov112-Isochrysis_galbana.AAC.2
MPRRSSACGAPGRGARPLALLCRHFIALHRIASHGNDQHVDTLHSTNKRGTHPVRSLLH